MHNVALEPPSFALKAANFFGVLGYAAVLLEWLWAGILFAYPFIKAGDLDWLMPAANPVPSPVVVAPIPANGAMLLVGVVVSILCLVIAAYTLYKMPKTIGKTGARLTHATAATVVPALTHQKKISKKTRQKLELRTVLAIKAMAIVVPALLALAIPSFSALSKDIVVLSTLFIAICALFHFMVQLTIAKAAKLNPNRVW